MGEVEIECIEGEGVEGKGNRTMQRVLSFSLSTYIGGGMSSEGCGVWRMGRRGGYGDKRAARWR